MSYELRIERQFDAPPEVVFDTFVDPATQEELHGSDQEGWKVHRCETDVRVGGTSTVVMGREGQDPDTETRVYSVIDRPHRLVFRYAMAVAEWGRTIDTEMTITFEDRDGGTCSRWWRRASSARRIAPGSWRAGPSTSRPWAGY